MTDCANPDCTTPFVPSDDLGLYPPTVRIEDSDGDILVVEPGDTDDSWYVGVQRGDHVQGVYLRPDQVDQLAAALVGDTTLGEQQQTRQEIVHDLLTMTVGTSAFTTTVSREVATAVIFMAAYIESGVDGVGDLNGALRA